MLKKIETFSLPTHVADWLDRGMLSVGVLAFASALGGILI